MTLRRRNLPSFLLFLTVLAGGISLIFLLWELRYELITQRRMFREDLVWIASQVEREARVFRHVAILYFDDSPTVSADDVKQRFDVLWSRIESMDKGDLGRVYLQLDDAQESLEYGRSMLETLDPIITDLERQGSGNREVVFALLDGTIDRFYKVASNASANNLQNQEQNRQSFEAKNHRAMVLVFLIFISGGILVFLIRHKQKALNQLMLTLEDKVQKRTRALEETTEYSSMLSLAIEQSPASVILYGLDHNIEYVNPQFERTSGYSSFEVIGLNPSFLQSGLTSANTHQEMWNTVRKGEIWQGQICNQHKKGHIYWEQISLTPVKDSNGAIVRYLAVTEDITERKKYEDALLHQATYDSLTGLPNRTHAMKLLAKAIEEAGNNNDSVGLMFIDLDHFKRINDTMGHDAGDSLLQEVAKRLSSSIRKSDIITRFGGDEFAIIFPGLIEDHPETKQILDKISKGFLTPFTVKGIEVFSSASIGISLAPENSVTPMTLFRQADTAMYQAKGAGRNTYCFFHEDMDRRAKDRMNVERHFRGALEREELQLHYQPIVNTNNGEIEGAEALLRWISPELGPVSPVDFIPIAEDSGLIVEIGKWTLKKACSDAQVWHEEFEYDWDIAINVSSRQFRETNFVETVQQVLEETTINPERVKLEITESLLIEDEHQALKIMEELKLMNVKLSLDDFGTGFSSLSYLNKFPFDTLKIDRAFLRNVVLDESDATLASAIISLGRRLKLDMVGEGVETIQQLEFLRENSCHLSQGFYFSKPLPAPELQNLARKAKGVLPIQ